MKFKTRGSAKTLSLTLDTSTWPPKGRGAAPGSGRSPEDAGRPRTATLDKPLVLDIALLGHLDMTTLTRRGLLNACRFRRNRGGVVGVLAPTPVPTTAASTPTPRAPPSRTPSRSDVSGDEATPVAGRRRGATPAGALVRQKKSVIEEDGEESSWAEDDRYSTYRVRRNNRLNRTFRIPALGALARGRRQPLDSIMNNNNVPEAAEAKVQQSKGRRGGPSLDDILGAREHVPEPCRTCGRPELPERLHSHPKLPGKPSQHHGYGQLHLAPPQPAPQPAPQPPAPVKNSVKKPVAIKYRPRRGSEGAAPNSLDPSMAMPRSPKHQATSPARRVSPAKGAFLVTHFVDPDGPASPSRAARAPRIVTCFVCGREFGTASLPLHEPQCIQRWTLQNTKLPPQWQRSLPEKPVGPITIDDWNKFAWDSSKRADSVQCPNCLRRFCPDRINSHERVCFKKQNVQPGEPQQAQPDSAHGRGSPLVECHLCRKKFGTRSIGIHEPQCLKKWQQTQQALGEGQPSGQPALDKARGQSQSPSCRLPSRLASRLSPSLLPTPTALRLQPLHHLRPPPSSSSPVDVPAPEPQHPAADPTGKVFPESVAQPSSPPPPRQRVSLSTKHRQRAGAAERPSLAGPSPPAAAPPSPPESSTDEGEEVPPGEVLLRRKEGSVIDVLLPRPSAQLVQPSPRQEDMGVGPFLIILAGAAAAAPATSVLQQAINGKIEARGVLAVTSATPVPTETTSIPTTSKSPSSAVVPVADCVDSTISSSPSSTSSSSSASSSSSTSPSTVVQREARENWCRPSFRVEEDGSTTYRCRVCNHGPIRRHFFRSQ